MTWLDERLFGWSRSAKRGTSVWGGSAISAEPSRAPSPDFSDEEETGDYESVVGIFGNDQTSLQRIKSRNSSYADLQRLKGSMTSIHRPEASSTALGEHRATHRQRRESLSDTVSVERIAAISPVETFPDVTSDLNEEIQKGLKYKSI